MGWPLSSFFPALRRHRGRPIEERELPEIVHWAPTQFEEVGVSLDRPQCVLIKTKAGLSEISFDFSRHSLLDRLILQLGDSMRLFTNERFLYALESDPRCVGDWSNVVRVFEQKTPELSRFIEFGDDNAQAIESLLVENMEFNECRHLYEIGCDFGRIISMLDRLARQGQRA